MSFPALKSLLFPPLSLSRTDCFSRILLPQLSRPLLRQSDCFFKPVNAKSQVSLWDIWSPKLIGFGLSPETPASIPNSAFQRDLNSKALLDCEAEWRCKLNVKEEEIIHLEAKLSKACGAQDPTRMEFKNNGKNFLKTLDLRTLVDETATGTPLLDKVAAVNEAAGRCCCCCERSRWTML
ncbi:unnamed protein product [Ilex paraguariensis]|uniref:Uncharacterized protein n=1 Tax=Ilex paraguariensis TaxID=185542 RepID=A0ABC8R7P6_9AQUA